MRLLALDALREGDDAEAARFFAREAQEFDASRADAEAAYWIWVTHDDSEELRRALEDPRFANQLGPGVLFDIDPTGVSVRFGDGEDDGRAPAYARCRRVR